MQIPLHLKHNLFVNGRTVGTYILMLILTTSIIGCKKKDTNNTTTTSSYQQVNLVADTSGWTGARVDPNLKNAWGIAVSPSGYLWISANHSAVSTVYDRNGAQVLSPVALNSGGAPTGVVYNSTSSFGGYKFLFAGEDGIISGWSSGSSTSIVADRSANSAVYKGLAIASDNGADFLYAADFKNGHIDVFDQNFMYVTTKPFADANIPAGFAPFNIYNHDGNLYVTYALHKGPDNEDDQKGAGNGYVNIFNPNGTLVKRFASQGTLNSPWGLVDAPAGFGLGDNMILVGNFGDGRINVFDSNGNYKGQLSDGTNPISIDGLWALFFPENNIPSGDQNQLFFTAGPADEEHGLFGYLKKK